jgi:O-antigen ligase
MALVAGSPRELATRVSRPEATVVAALMFLFAGLYKAVLPTGPVDLTIVAGLLLCLTLSAHVTLAVPLVRSPVVATLAILAVWLSLRLYPQASPWGIRKLAEFVLFGAPALLAGAVIARSPDMLATLMRWLAWVCVPGALFVAAQAALTSPYAPQGIGSGGYQLTGTLFALGALAAVATRRQTCLGFALFGISVTGHLSAAFFSAVAIAFIWWRQRGQRRILPGLALAVGLMALNTALVAPPLVAMRVLYKSGGVVMMLAEHYQIESIAGIKLATIGAAIASALRAMPEESHQFEPEARQADRIPIYGAAVRWFAERPFLGHGYGSLNYAGVSRTAHNVVLELLAEAGLIAGLLGAFVIAYGATSFGGARSPPELFVAGVFILMALTAMVSGYWGERLFLFTLGMALAARIQVSQYERLFLFTLGMALAARRRSGQPVHVVGEGVAREAGLAAHEVEVAVKHRRVG